MRLTRPSLRQIEDDADEIVSAWTTTTDVTRPTVGSISSLLFVKFTEFSDTRSK